VRVLFVNHTAQVSGGERSLHDVLRALPVDVATAVACPDGPFADSVHTPSAIAGMGSAVAAVRRISRRFCADLIHGNSIRAGLIAGLAAPLNGRPAVVYVRDVLPPGRVSGLSISVAAREAAALLPNSQHTARALPPELGHRIRVIYSALDLRRFDPEAVDGQAARRSLGLHRDDIALAMVAQLTPWKAQDDAIRVVARLRSEGHNVRLLLVGSAKFVARLTRYDNDAYRAWLGKLTCALEVEDAVHFIGERDDIPSILAASDIALVPSWEEPFGRSVVEAMAMKRVVVATNVGGPCEIITHERDGLLLPPREPELWTDAVRRLIVAPELRRDMGSAARARVAEAFRIESHVDALLDVYDRVLRREPVVPPAREARS
jgi:L-malate glycosyltransferase